MAANHQPESLVVELEAILSTAPDVVDRTEGPYSLGVQARRTTKLIASSVENRRQFRKANTPLFLSVNTEGLF